MVPSMHVRQAVTLVPRDPLSLASMCMRAVVHILPPPIKIKYLERGPFYDIN